MALLFSVIIAAGIGVGGYFFTRYYFKSKETEEEHFEYTRKQKLIFIAAAAVIFAAVAVCFPLLIKPEDKGIFEILRTVTATLALFYVAIIDYKFKVIPNKYLLGLLGLTVALLGAEAIFEFGGFRFTIVMSLLGSLVCGTLFMITNLVSRNGLGMGDVKLMYIIGLLVGLDDALGGLIWTFGMSAVYGIVLMIMKKLKMKSRIALGPFFFLGFLGSNIMYIVSGYMGG